MFVSTQHDRRRIYENRAAFERELLEQAARKHDRRWAIITALGVLLGIPIVSLLIELLTGRPTP